MPVLASIALSKGGEREAESKANSDLLDSSKIELASFYVYVMCLS